MSFGGACNLGSLFIQNFIKNPFTKKAYLDTELLSKAIKVAVRFLDDVIDVNVFPDKIYENYQKNMRTIGIGMTGLADALAMLGLKYNSKEAYDYVDNLFELCTIAEYRESIELAKEKGMFNFCNPEKHAKGNFVLNNLPLELRNDIEKYGIRNAKIQAVAPTGTLSLTFGNNCSSGIEPIFSLSYDRKAKIGGK